MRLMHLVYDLRRATGAASGCWDGTYSLENAFNGYKHQFQPTTEGIFIIARVMVGVVSKLGSLVNPDDANDIATKVEQCRHLAGRGQAFNIRTVPRATFLDMVFSSLSENRQPTSHNLAQLEEWW